MYNLTLKQEEQDLGRTCKVISGSYELTIQQKGHNIGHCNVGLKHSRDSKEEPKVKLTSSNSCQGHGVKRRMYAFLPLYYNCSNAVLMESGY